MYVAVGDKIYTFYEHALSRMKDRGIQFEWVEMALLTPDDVTQLTTLRYAYDKMLADDKSIRVVVDEAERQIVTVYYTETEE